MKITCFLLFLLLFCDFCGSKVHITSFEDNIRKGSATARCVFQFSYNDKAVKEVDISCYDVSKVMTVNYAHTSDTLHTISIRFKILKNGKTKVYKGKTKIVRGITYFQNKSYCKPLLCMNYQDAQFKG